MSWGFDNFDNLKCRNFCFSKFRSFRILVHFHAKKMDDMRSSRQVEAALGLAHGGVHVHVRILPNGKPTTFPAFSCRLQNNHGDVNSAVTAKLSAQKKEDNFQIQLPEIS